jgi:regulator of protease activity HflC (stomatin/prohibitin superfamily)
MNQDPSVKNPFVQIHAVNLTNCFRPFRPDGNHRIVWVKGTMAKLQETGEFLCPIPKYNTVAVVLMAPVTLPINFKGELFIEKDNLPLDIQLTVTARVRDEAKSLQLVATHFDHSVDNLTSQLSSLLRKECKKLSGQDINLHETRLSERIVQAINDSASEFHIPLYIIAATPLKLRCDSFEGASSTNQDEENTAELERKRLERQADLDCQKNGYALINLREKIEREYLALQQSLQIDLARGRNDSELFALKRPRLDAMANMCIEAKLILAGDDPNMTELFAKIEITRLGVEKAKVEKDYAALEKAIKLCHELVQATASAYRNYPSDAGPNISISNSSPRD